MASGTGIAIAARDDGTNPPTAGAPATGGPTATGRSTAPADPGPPSAPPDPQRLLDPVASWNPGRGQRNAVPDVVGRHPATLVGSAVAAPGPNGAVNAVHLDGATGAANTGGPVLDVNRSFSVEVWVSLDRLLDGSVKRLVTATSQDDGRDSGFAVQFAANLQRFTFFTDAASGRRARSRTAPAAHVWYHLVGVRDYAGGTRQLYVDGRLQDSVPVGVVAPLRDPGPVQIGRSQFEGQQARYWPGSIARVSLYQRALTADEVSRLHRLDP